MLFYLRYLQPKEKGLGVLLDCTSSNVPYTLKQWAAEKPQLFENSGCYTVMVATQDVMDK